MKVVKYELTIVHKKTVSVSAEDKKHVEELLKNVLGPNAGLEVSVDRGCRNVWKKTEKSAVQTVRTIVMYADAVN